ncbi:phosphatidylserine decarboxylase-related protein [Campylobacter lanienae NCTC 13004]|uniref:Phosphatidylserine decarboxylase-related protein n=1 Tax=Campylobacter lanienae NCTC 13004 TaxID=1031753 RepID=A0A1X9SNQ0_9BACT|nr:phosphatidylserine decarboxylase-related protein [Campylobacter lanienae NCTC 13004]
MDNLGIISKYGYKCVFIAFVLFVLSWIFNFWPLIFGLLFLISLWIYKNPEKLPQSEDPKAILSPIDGIVEDIKKSNYNGRAYTQILIRNRIFDSGVLRSICDMDISVIKRRNGLNIHSSDPNLNLLSNRATIISKNQDFIIRISTSALTSKIYLENLKYVKSGRRIGFLKDGKVAILMPLNTRIAFSKGDKIKACSVIGYIDE